MEPVASAASAAGSVRHMGRWVGWGAVRGEGGGASSTPSAPCAQVICLFCPLGLPLLPTAVFGVEAAAHIEASQHNEFDSKAQYEANVIGALEELFRIL